MSQLTALQQERSHKALSAKEVVEGADKAGRPMTADEVALFDKLTAEVDSLDARIKAHLEHADRVERLAKVIESQRQTLPEPVKPATIEVAPRVHATARRYGALRAHKGPNAEARAYRNGMWARAVILRDEKAARWCQQHGVATWGGDLQAAHGTTPNSAGGVLVPDETAQDIIDLRESYGVFRQNCRVWPMRRDTLTIPRRASGLTVAAVGESSALSESDTSWNGVQLTAKKCGGLTRMSTEIAEDAIIDLGDMLVEEAAYAFSYFEDRCGFIGDGTSTYLGIRGLTNLLTTASSLTGAVAAASGHDTMAEIDASDLAKVMAALPEYARMNAKWYCSAVALDLIFGRLMAAAGGNTIQTIQGGYQRSYLGYPVVVSQVLPTSQSTINGTAILFFGDLSKSSALGDRREMRILVSDQRYMEYDQVAISFLSRIDIVNHDVGTTSAAGPIVGLMGTT